MRDHSRPDGIPPGSPHGPGPGRPGVPAWLAGGLLAVTLAVFAGVCGHGFVHFDDNINIYDNPHLRGLTAESWAWMWTDTSYAKRYLPLGWLAYAALQQGFGLDPRAFHAAGLLLHLANVGLLFVLLQRLVRIAHPDRPALAAWCAGAGALFWAVNPLRVEVVAWASALIYSQATLLALAWLLGWLRAQDETLPAGARRIAHAGALTAYAGSLLTYPLALFAPVLLFALEIFPLRRAGWRAADWCGPGTGRRWTNKLPSLALAAAGLCLTAWARADAGGQYNHTVGLAQFGLVPRLLQACYVAVYYVWKPWLPLDLAPVYPELHGFHPLAPAFLASAALVAGLTAWTWRNRQVRPGWALLWACHLVLLVPFLGLTEYPHSTADRYAHLPGLLWSALLAFGLGTWALRPRRATRISLAAGAVGAACAAAAWLAWQQVPVWQHTIPLHRHLVARLGDDPGRAHYDEILGVHCLRAGLTNEAILSFQQALRHDARRPAGSAADPGITARAHLSLGNIHGSQGRPEAALDHYRAALQADPASASAAVNLGLTYAELQRFAEARDSLETALRLNPSSVSAHHNLGLLLRRLGHEEDARRHLEEARRLLASR